MSKKKEIRVIDFFDSWTTFWMIIALLLLLYFMQQENLEVLFPRRFLRRQGLREVLIFLSLLVMVTVSGVRYFWLKSRLVIRSRNLVLELRKLAEREPEWTPERLLDFSRNIIPIITQMRNKQDVLALEELLHRDLFIFIRHEIASRKPVDELIEFRSLSIADLRLIDVQNYADNEKDNFTVYFEAYAKEINQVLGVELGRDEVRISEFWTFEREQNTWKLLSILPSTNWRYFVNRKLIDEGI